MFVDALDECDEKDARRIVEFFESTATSAFSTGASLRICLSSRHYPNIRLNKCLEIHMEYKNERDIEIYVHTKLGSGNADEETLELETMVVHKASGVFLWVVLIIEMLLKAQDDGESNGRMQQILTSTPAQLDELFAQNLRTLNAAEKKEAFTMMQWVLLSEVPLEVELLRCALHSNADFRVFQMMSNLPLTHLWLRTKDSKGSFGVGPEVFLNSKSN